MSLAGRILVGFNGHLPDDGLIRYAAMVARLHQPDSAPNVCRQARRRTAFTTGSVEPVDPCQTTQRTTSVKSWMRDSREIRFVSLLSQCDALAPSPRAALAAKLQQHFAALPQYGSINVDLLKGRPLERLAALAADFDADVLLLDNAADSRRRCGRLAVAAPCAVWLVPPAWAPVLRRILVPIDLSYRAAHSLQLAVDLASRFPPAKCLALHVDTHASRFDDTIAPARQRELMERLLSLLTTIDTRGVRIEPMFVKSHHVDRAIEGASLEHTTDLTVMICRRRSRWASAMHPSLVESVIRQSRGPVLLLKSSEEMLNFWEAMCIRCQNTELAQYS